MQPHEITESVGLEIMLVEQPEKIEFFMADNVFIKQLYMKLAGYVIPGHAHTYDHTSMVATGAVRVWADDALLGDFIAPTGVEIKAGKMHTMLSLEDNTTMYCVHNTHGHELHEIEDKLVVKKNGHGASE